MYLDSQEAHWTHDMWLDVFLHFSFRLWRVQVQRVQHLLPRLGPRRHGEALRQRPRRHRRPLQVPRLPRRIVSQVRKKTNMYFTSRGRIRALLTGSDREKVA